MRIKNSVRNVFYAFIGQALGLVISFISRLVFIKILGTEYLGISGLLTNILTILSFTELGIGTSISISLYKPLENHDTEKLKTLMKFFKNIYSMTGLVIIVLGLLSLPIYKYTMSTIPNIDNLDIIYLLFVLNTAISYFFNYKRTLIISDQKRYIASIYRYGFYFVLNTIQIIILIFSKDYIIFLICQILFTFFENYFLSKKADKMYPYLKDKNVKKIQKKDLKDILKTFKYIVFHKFGGMVLKSTDNICISKILGVTYVGLYSNYYLITSALDTIISQIFNSIVASIGNLNVNNTRKKMQQVFDNIFFINSWIYSFSCTCLIILLNPFICLWLGKNYILNFGVVLAIVGDFYIHGMRKTCLSFREATGNYKEDRFSPLIEAGINITVSIILTKKIGLAGVFIGTIVSCLFTCFWWEPKVIYKQSLKDNVLKYFRYYLKYFMEFLFTLIITAIISNQISNLNVLTFIIKILICIIIPNVILLILNFRSCQFKFFLNLINKKKGKI